MGYRTVFEVSVSTLPWWIPLLGLVVAAIGIFFFFNGRRTPRSAGRMAFGVYAIVFGALITVVTLFVIRRDYCGIRGAYASHRYSVVEGRVEDFVPMPPGGHRDESFSVGGMRFSYSGYTVTPCFHQTAVQGGPIRDGINIRVFYIGGCIVRLDVRMRNGRNNRR
jgi:hypothetical protein